MLRDYLQNYDNRNSTIEHVLHRARSTTTDQSEKQRFTTLIKQNMPPLTYLYRKAKDIDTIPTLSNAPLNERASKAKSILATGKLTTGVSGAASAALLVATVYCGIKSFHARKRIQAIIPAINNDEKI